MSTINRQNLELGPRDQLIDWQSHQLRSLIDAVVPQNRFVMDKFHGAGLDPKSVRTVEDLPRIPFTTKSELVSDQIAHPPYGRNLSEPMERYSRLHQTSGTTTGQPLRWLDTAETWNSLLECWSTIYRWMNVRPDDRLCFPFSFGPFLGFWAGFEGALRHGRLCIAAGGMSSEARLKLIIENRITILGCTPTYALRLAEVASQLGVNLAETSVRALLVAGEPGGSIPSIRSRIEAAWHARVFDHWGMTEIGPLGSECEDDPGVLTLLEADCISEVIDPATCQPVPDGTPGELVITTLSRNASPLFRYRTGDIVEVSTSPSPSTRNFRRLTGGILGRTDDMLIVRGNNVFPSGIESILREFPEIAEFRIVVSRHREMQQLRIDIDPDPTMIASDDESFCHRVARVIKERLQFQPEVRLVPAGTLPRFEMKAKRLVRE